MNHVVLMGRLARDPELRNTPSGIPVVRFTVAVNRRFVSKDTNERQADFIDCVAWRGTAEFISKYFAKGAMIAVQGSLQVREWQDKEGNKRWSTEVIVEQAYFTGSKQDTGTSGGGGYGRFSDKDAPPIDAGYGAPVAGSDFAELDDDDGELPF
ncbi:MAG: single-stranded DNA-binding protein [Oscillospiraceae bacterium]|nr:single-stranded DNA-binding protein [Oscillospiraceae bacterium]